MNNTIYKPDWILIIAIVMQAALGLVFIYSVSGSYSEQTTGNYFSFFHHYLLALLFSFIIAALIYNYYSSNITRKYSNWILILVFCLLCAVLIPGVASIRGAKLGLTIGSVFIYLLPLVTLLLIVSTSRYISEHYNNNSFRSVHTWIIPLVFLSICFLILNQPNAKGIIILGILLVIMCFSAKLYKVSGLLILILILITIGFAIEEPYGIRRIMSFIDPFGNRSDYGYSLSMSLSAIGGGNLLGVGYGEGLVNQKLPDAFDGFMFSSIIEETGFSGILVIVLCSVLIQWRSFAIAQSLICHQRNNEGLIVIGIASWVSLLSILHMSVCLGVFPTHYVPYPFLSFDHSYLSVLLVGNAIILRIGLTTTPITCSDNIRLQPASTILLLLFFLIVLKTLFSSTLDHELSEHYLKKADLIKREIQKKQKTNKDISTSDLRGRITERYGKVLAKNRPMFDIWVDPSKWVPDQPHWKDLMALLSADEAKVYLKLSKYKKVGKHFAYLKRKVDPDIALQVSKLAIEGIYTQEVYYRYYPNAELTSQVVGITNINDIGQEGIERQFEQFLKRNSKKSQAGHDLQLSIDLRMQQAAYRELKKAVTANGAESGSVVLLNAQTGEVLAMVSTPSFYPNNQLSDNISTIRNRVISDVFEPGGTIIPFVLLSALESNHYTAGTLIDTYMTTEDHMFKAEQSKIALNLPKDSIYQMLKKAGFGQNTKVELPGESMGRLNNLSANSDAVENTLSHGYGLAVTALQLAQAYMMIANNGQLIPVTILKRSTIPESKQVIPPLYTAQLRDILMSDNNLLKGRGSVVYKYTKNGYSQDKVLYVYAGMASIKMPSLVIVVTVNQPDLKKEGSTLAANISEQLAVDIIKNIYDYF